MYKLDVGLGDVLSLGIGVNFSGLLLVKVCLKVGVIVGVLVLLINMVEVKLVK